jgi:antitoxin ParD1/3/4
MMLEPEERSAVSAIERLTITLPSEMAAVVKGAVEGGDYASSSEVVREALRDWNLKRALQLQELAALKADIDKGLSDLAEGRLRDFDADRIIERGRRLLANRSPSAWSTRPRQTLPTPGCTWRPKRPRKSRPASSGRSQRRSSRFDTFRLSLTWLRYLSCAIDVTASWDRKAPPFT